MALRNEKGLFVKASPASEATSETANETAESSPEGEGAVSAESPEFQTEGEGDRLAEYRQQENQLTEAFARVKAIHAETATLTTARDTALSQRQTLLNKWIESENEESVEELAKLGARGEVFEAKLSAQAVKLGRAEAELKQRLETFGNSFRNLHAALQKFLFDSTLDRILAQVHPTLRIQAKATCTEAAWCFTEVVDIQSLRIHTLNDEYLPVPSPADTLRVAGQSLPKVEALLAEAAKHPEFVPPVAYTEERWRAAVAAGAAAEAKAQQERAAIAAERAARPNPHAVTPRIVLEAAPLQLT
jgi:hypothetical protein